MTVEAKMIEVSEIMDGCAEVHNIAYNNMEEDEAQQEEDDDRFKQEKFNSE
jgi:hypothetical protein